MSATQQKPQPATTASSDQLICTYERPVGSHLPQKVCMTSSERDELARQSQDTMSRTRNSGYNPSKAGDR